MGTTVTFRLDAESERILRELAPGGRDKSAVIRRALKEHWESQRNQSRPNSWEVYESLGIRPQKPTRDRARHVDRLLKEKLIAKRQKGAL
jgi:hypothetical protein